MYRDSVTQGQNACNIIVLAVHFASGLFAKKKKNMAGVHQNVDFFFRISHGLIFVDFYVCRSRCLKSINCEKKHYATRFLTSWYNFPGLKIIMIEMSLCFHKTTVTAMNVWENLKNSFSKFQIESPMFVLHGNLGNIQSTCTYKIIFHKPFRHFFL